MRQKYHEILDDKNTFLIQLREVVQLQLKKKEKQKQKALPENYSRGQSVQDINALLRCFTENLHHMKISLDLKQIIHHCSNATCYCYTNPSAVNTKVLHWTEDKSVLFQSGVS